MCAQNQRGFTLIELLVAMIVGLVVIGGAVLLFSHSVSSAALISNQVDAQQNARSALNAVTQDLTMAGTGIPAGGITIPPGSLGNSASPRFGCDSFTCYVTNNNYIHGVLYSVMPGHGSGPGILGDNSDAVAILYVDPLLSNPNPDITPPPLAWNSFPISPATGPCPANGSVSPDGTSVTMPQPFCTGNDVTSPLSPAFNDPSVNLEAGDMMMFTTSNGYAVGVTTNINFGTQTIYFGSGDALNMNSSLNGFLPIANLATPPGSGAYPPVTVSRVLLVSYFLEGLDVNGQPVATGAVDSRLMRQLNAQTPVAVADHVTALNITYDVANSTANGGGIASPDASVDPPDLQNAQPNQIRKIHVTLTVRSATKDSQGHYQYFALNSTVSPRNLAFLPQF